MCVCVGGGDSKISLVKENPEIWKLRKEKLKSKLQSNITSVKSNDCA